MRVNQDVTGILNILVNNSDSLTRVQVGQIMAARVLEILAEGQALIMFKGEKILAETQVPMQKGQEVLLEVTGLQQGQLRLKVVPDSVVEGRSLPPEQVVKALTQANLPVDKFHLDVVRKLLQHNLPATPANIKQVLGVLQNLGSREPALVMEAVKLMAEKTPVTAAGVIISAVARGLQGSSEPSQQQALGQVRAALEQVILSKNLPPSEPASPIMGTAQPAVVKSPLPALVQQLELLVADTKPDRSPSLGSNQGATAPRTLQYSPEVLVKVLQESMEYPGGSERVITQGSPQVNPGTSSNPGSNTLLPHLQRLKDILTPLIAGEATNLNQVLNLSLQNKEQLYFVIKQIREYADKVITNKESDEFFNPVADKGQLIGQLVRMLEGKPNPVKALLQDVVTEQGISSRSLPVALINQAEVALAMLEQADQRVEQPGQRIPGQGEVFYLPLPIRNEQQTQMSELFVWQRDNREGKSLEEGLYLAFFLNTENLGSLRVDVAVKGYHLDIYFLVESAKIAGIIQKGISGLAASLQNAGFDPGSLQCNVKTQGVSNPGTLWEPPKSGLDLLV